MNMKKWLSLPIGLAMSTSLFVSPLMAEELSSDPETTVPAESASTEETSLSTPEETVVEETNPQPLMRAAATPEHMDITGATITFDKDSYMVGDMVNVTGTFETQPIKDKIQKIVEDYRPAFAAYSGGLDLPFETFFPMITLSETMSQFRATMTLTDGLSPLFDGVTMANVSNFNSTIFKVDSVAKEGNSVVLMMSLNRTFANFKELYDAVMNETPTLQVTVGSTMPYAESEPMTFETVWNVSGEEVPSGKTIKKYVGDVLELNGVDLTDLQTKVEATLANFPEQTSGSFEFSTEFSDEVTSVEFTSKMDALDKLTALVTELKENFEAESYTLTEDDMGLNEGPLSIDFTLKAPLQQMAYGKVEGVFHSEASYSTANIAFDFTWTTNEANTSTNLMTEQLYLSDYLLSVDVMKKVERPKTPSKTPKTATPVQWFAPSLMGAVSLAGFVFLKKRS